jgi:hypothetical protein
MAGTGTNVVPTSTSSSLIDNPSTLAPGSLGSADLGSLLSGLDSPTSSLSGSDIGGIDVGSTLGAGAGQAVPSFGGDGTSVGTTSAATGGSSLSSLLSGIAGSNLGTLAGYGGVYALLASEASSAASENDALAGDITAIGQPLVTQGQGLTSAFSKGQLTSPYQQQVTAAEEANQNTATSESQQVASLLAGSSGGQNIQGAEASESQQIKNAQTQANTQAISTAFQNELSSGLGLVGTGGGFVQAGVTQEIQSNTQLQQQLSQLMGMLANAYAKQTSGSAGTAAGGVGGFSSLLNTLLGSGSTAGIGAAATGDAAAANSGLNANNLTVGNNVDADMSGQVSSSLAQAGDTSGISANLQNASVTTGDFALDDGTSISSDVSSGLLSDSGGIADDLSGFSDGSAAAGATEGLATAATPDVSGIVAPSVNYGADSATGSLAGVGGDVLGLAGVATNPTNVGGDISGAADVYNLGAAATGGAPIGAGAAGAGLEVAVPAFMISTLVGAETKPNEPDTINTQAAEAAGMDVNPYGTLPSGNSILTDQGLGVGAGTQSGQGSGELYRVNPDGSVAGNTVYDWLGQSTSTALEGDVAEYDKAEAGQPSSTPTDGLGLTTSSPGDITAFGSSVAQTPVETPKEEEAGASANIASYYASLGGEKAFGMSESDFQQTLLSMLGSDAYFHGTAYGSPN